MFTKKKEEKLIPDYTIIEAGNVKNLVVIVKDHLALGWKCEGGLQIANGVYFQSMTR